LLISVYLMFLHLAHIGIFDVSASCSYLYIWCFCILLISVYLMFNANIKIQKSEIDILMFSVQIWFGMSTWTQFALCRYSLSIMNWWPVYMDTTRIVLRICKDCDLTCLRWLNSYYIHTMYILWFDLPMLTRTGIMHRLCTYDFVCLNRIQFAVRIKSVNIVILPELALCIDVVNIVIWPAYVDLIHNIYSLCE
jgi:hypothetical protein